MATQEAKIIQLQREFEEHKQGPVPTKGLAMQNYKEKDAYLQYEVTNRNRIVLRPEKYRNVLTLVPVAPLQNLRGDIECPFGC